jgi:hypothetical protein
MNPQAVPDNPPTGSIPQPTISTPAGTGVKISDVNQSLWQYIKKRKLWELILVLPFAILWEIAIIFFFTKYSQVSKNNNSQNNQGLGYLLIAPILLLSSWVYKLKKQFEAAFLEEFASANNYSFDKNGGVDETYGSIFRLSGQQSVSDVITGAYGNNSLRLFLYELVVGSGRYQQRYHDTVIEIDMHGQLPNLLMMNNQSKMGRINLSGAFGIKNTLQLEGDFNQYFTLFAPQGNEVEALEVFTPDTMALMEDESAHYTVEFAGNRVYIYCNGFITTSENLNQVFTLAKKLTDKLAPLASRLGRDSAIAATPINIIKVRKRHPFTRKIGIEVIVTFVVVGLGLMVSAILNARQQSTNNNSSASTAQSAPLTITNTQTTDPNASPYCGAIPNSSMPAAELAYLNGVITFNKGRQPLSDAIASDPNGLPTYSQIDQQISLDQQFLASLQTITYPAAASSDATAFENSVKNYDSLIGQEANGQSVPNTTLVNARSARDSASIQLRKDLGLPAGTCGFNEP